MVHQNCGTFFILFSSSSHDIITMLHGYDREGKGTATAKDGMRAAAGGKGKQGRDLRHHHRRRGPRAIETTYFILSTKFLRCETIQTLPTCLTLTLVHHDSFPRSPSILHVFSRYVRTTYAHSCTIVQVYRLVSQQSAPPKSQLSSH
jgi:hypothetical protein